jgi:hypothetical protein
MTVLMTVFAVTPPGSLAICWQSAQLVFREHFADLRSGVATIKI